MDDNEEDRVVVVDFHDLIYQHRRLVMINCNDLIYATVMSQKQDSWGVLSKVTIKINENGDSITLSSKDILSFKSNLLGSQLSDKKAHISTVDDSFVHFDDNIGSNFGLRRLSLECYRAVRTSQESWLNWGADCSENVIDKAIRDKYVPKRNMMKIIINIKQIVYNFRKINYKLNRQCWISICSWWKRRK